MKVVLISYHYHPYPGYRSSLVYHYFRKRLIGSADSLTFLHADWDHQSKTRFEPSSDGDRIAIPVPKYQKNLSPQRIWSHLVFAWKTRAHPALLEADLVYVCVPPSLSALIPAWRAHQRGKPWILDLVDLWPEALPASPLKKCLLNVTIGWIWKACRNFFYSRATMLLSHCRYFLKELQMDPKRSAFVPLAQPQKTLANLMPSSRTELQREIRLLVLGSINHVLDTNGLVKLVEHMAPHRPVVVEILGAGENKARLLQNLQSISGCRVHDHGMNFDVPLKAKILSRCHFGYNGYSSQTAIGITYKSIDFASQGLVFLNSVRGDLRDFVDQYQAGFNYLPGQENEVAQKILNLGSHEWDTMSSASRKIYEDLFRLESFEERMDNVLAPQKRFR